MLFIQADPPRCSNANHIKNFFLSMAILSLIGIFSAEARQEQQFFITPVGGYSFGASDFDFASEDGKQQDKLSINESENYAVMLGLTTHDPGDMYLLYSHQRTEFRSGGAFTAETVSDLQVDYLHVGGTLYFPNGVWEPYLSASIGLTQFRPSGDFSNETRFSMGLGLGNIYRISEHFALIAEVRGFATLMNSDHDLFCDGMSCKWKIDGSTLFQGQVNLGIQFRF